MTGTASNVGIHSSKRDIQWNNIPLTTLRRNSFQKILRNFLARPLQRFDENDALIWLRSLRVEALYPEWHRVVQSTQSITSFTTVSGRLWKVRNKKESGKNFRGKKGEARIAIRDVTRQERNLALSGGAWSRDTLSHQQRAYQSNCHRECERVGGEKENGKRPGK